MSNIFIIFMGVFFSLIGFTVIKESIYQKKKKKVVIGARFNNKWKSEAAPIEWVTVTNINEYAMCVFYRIDGEEEIKDMFIRDFVKIYVP